MPRLKSLCLLFVIFTFLTGCQTVPYTNRSQLMLISEPDEIQLGHQAFAEVLKQERVSSNPSYNARVQRVGKRIAQAAQKPEYNWEFIVLESKQVNAFCLPGGKVAVYTGLLKVAPSDDLLATVISHEVAHALARHAGERMSQDLLVQVTGAGLSAGLGGQSELMRKGVMQAFGLGSQVGVLLPYSRKQEEEADHIGVILMAKAGYDPRAALDFWRKMMEATKDQGKPPELLSTHPSDERRLAKIEKDFLPEALQYYKR